MMQMTFWNTYELVLYWSTEYTSQSMDILLYCTPHNAARRVSAGGELVHDVYS